MTIMYAYFLGLALIGPFDTLEGCQQRRDFQMTWGTQEEVTECWVVVRPEYRSYQVMSPTYDAPLTVEEAQKRAK